LLTEETVIDINDTSETLSLRLSEIGASLLIKTISELKNGNLKPIKQVDSLSSLAPMLKKEHGNIDWTKTAIEIRNQIRGLLPWPCAFTHLNGKMLKIFDSGISDEKGNPGQVVYADKNILRISCAKGSLELLQVQLEGNRKMDIKSFLMGRQIEIGTTLI